LVELRDRKRLLEMSKSQSEDNIKRYLNVYRADECEMDMFGSEWGTSDELLRICNEPGGSVNFFPFFFFLPPLLSLSLSLSVCLPPN